MKKIQLTITLLLIPMMFSCSGSELSEVDSLVVEACGLVKSNRDSDDKGSWVGPSTELSDGGWNRWSTPIEDLIKIRDGWSESAIPAASAAQMDSKFRELANAVRLMLDAMLYIVQLREAVDSGKGDSYYANWNGGGINDYNKHLQTWRIECNATAQRLELQEE